MEPADPGGQGLALVSNEPRFYLRKGRKTAIELASISGR
jgi:hypothetical protein